MTAAQFVGFALPFVAAALIVLFLRRKWRREDEEERIEKIERWADRH